MAPAPVRIESIATAGAFLTRAGAFLEAREAEHNLIFGIAAHVRNDPLQYGNEPPRFLVVTDPQDRVVAAALRTPPFNLVVSLVEDPAAIGAIGAHVADHDPSLPGVNGPAEVAPVLAADIATRLRASTRAVISERIYRLRRVVPPPPASGTMRAAEERDRALLVRWLRDFSVEALPHQQPPDGEALADRWIGAAGRRMYLWEDEGRVVSLTGVGGETPHGIRVGPVYTPPEARGRGYASNLVAGASQAQLDAGRRFVFLFTDLANPTSNAIYQAIGYEPVSDVLEVAVDRSA